MCFLAALKNNVEIEYVYYTFRSFLLRVLAHDIPRVFRTPPESHGRPTKLEATARRSPFGKIKELPADRPPFILPEVLSGVKRTGCNERWAVVLFMTEAARCCPAACVTRCLALHVATSVLTPALPARALLEEQAHLLVIGRVTK